MEQFKLTKTMKHIITHLEKDINNKLKEKDLSFSQSIILVKINENGELPLKELEKKFAVAQSTIFGVISRLEKKGLVETYLLENKTKVAKITEEGKTLIEFIIDAIHVAEDKAFEGFTATEKSVFIELLKKAESNLTDC